MPSLSVNSDGYTALGWRFRIISIGPRYSAPMVVGVRVNEEAAPRIEASKTEDDIAIVGNVSGKLKTLRRQG